MQGQFFHGRMCVGALTSLFDFTSKSSTSFSCTYMCWCTHITLWFYNTSFYIVQNWNNINEYIRSNTTVPASSLWNFTHSFPSYLTYLRSYLSNSLYLGLLLYGGWMYFKCNYFGWIQYREWYKIKWEGYECKDSFFTGACVLAHSHHSLILHQNLLQVFHARICVGVHILLHCTELK